MTIHWLWIAISTCIVIALLTGHIYERIGAARDAIRCPPTGEMIDVGGRRLHLLRKGAGSPTVIVENGSGAASHIWWAIQDKLAELTTVCTYDRAGLGWSDPASLPRTLEERAADLHAVLVHAQVPPPYLLVGYSHGGLLIRLFARDHRDAIAGLVFVDSGHESVYSSPEGNAKRTRTAFRMYGFLSRIGVVRLFRLSMGAFLKTRPAAALHEAQAQVAKNWLPTTHSYSVGADENLSAVRANSALAGTNIPGGLGDIPIAVITHGIPFPMSSVTSESKWRAAQEQLAALSTNSTLVVATKSGHLVPLEEPELVIDAIRKVVIAARSNEKLSAIA